MEHLLPKQVEREFKNIRNGCFWRQTATICVTWLCLSNEKVNIPSHIPECFIQLLMKLLMMAFSVNSKGRTFISGKPINDSLRGSIIDTIIADGGDASSGFFPGTFTDVANRKARTTKSECKGM